MSKIDALIAKQSKGLSTLQVSAAKQNVESTKQLNFRTCGGEPSCPPYPLRMISYKD